MTKYNAKGYLLDLRDMMDEYSFHFSREFRDAVEVAIECIDNQIKIFDNIGEFSDGYHTFNSLYEQRMHLFALIVNQNKELCWKTHRHEDGELCFNSGWFLVTIKTPDGNYGYHYEDKYWDLFNCKEIEKAEKWDGYTDADVSRLMSLVKG